MTGCNKKILAFRIGRVGDMVMVTAAIKALIDYYPDAQIHLVTNHHGQRIFNAFHPNLTKIHLYDQHIPQRLWLDFKIKKVICNGHYDKIFCFETKPRYIQFLEQSATAEKFILPGRDRPMHFSQYCVDLVKSSVANPQEHHWDYLPTTTAGEQAAKEALQTIGVTDKTLLVGFHPTYHGYQSKKDPHNYRPHKRWAPENFGKLAKIITKFAEQQNLDLKIVLDLLPEECAIGEEIVAKSGGIVNLLTLPANFQRYKALVKRMNSLVTTHTGTMHLACATRTPQVVLFSRFDPSDCGPYMPASEYRLIRAEDQSHGERGLSVISPELVFSKWLELTGLAI